MSNKLNLIFPMAGAGSRFGYSFKPFLEVGDKGNFIELAFKPFRKHISKIDRVIFIFLREQEEKYDVSNNLSKIFKGIDHETCILKEMTSGPAETIRLALKKNKIFGSAIICDCDHSLNVDKIFEEIDSYDCVLPVWSLKNEKIKSWSIVSVNDNSQVTGIAEKKIPPSVGQFYGVIGCYYLKKSSFLFNERYKNISDCIKDLIKLKLNIKVVKINEASFFGDPNRLKNTLNEVKTLGTIFCDLDGTLIEHEDTPSNFGIKVLDGAYKTLRGWKNKNYYIILTTARNSINRKYLESELSKNNIIYDELIMDLSSGTRIIINDRKPSNILVPSAVAYEVERNKGIKNLEIDIPDVKIIKRMKGGSFADTLLIQKNKFKYIRKVASKRVNLELGYLRLKKQFDQLQRFTYFHESLVPNLIKEQENSFEYFFDMEYLTDYRLLSDCKGELVLKSLNHLLEIMKNKIYIQSAELSQKNTWLEQHLNNKIFNKLRVDLYDGLLNEIIKRDEIIINSKNYQNINSTLATIFKKYNHTLSPKYLCPIHGDLTFENILCKEDFGLDVKLIDMDGAEYLDAIELDMGKMFQSIITKYEVWSKLDTKLVSYTKDGFVIKLFQDFEDISSYIDIWHKVIESDKSILSAKAYFYTSLHLIRMIRFRLKISEDQATYALLLSILLLNLTLTKLDEIKS